MRQRLFDIKWHVYAPLNWQKIAGLLADKERCRYAVWDIRDGHYQCSRDPVETLHGHGFCKQHAAMVRKDEARRVTP